MIQWLSKKFKGEDRPDYKSMLEQGALLIDVRSPAEFAGGHLQGAVNIPLHQLNHKIGKIKKKKKPVIAYCRSGRRSGIAANMLREQKIEAYNAGGFRRLRKEWEQ